MGDELHGPHADNQAPADGPPDAPAPEGPTMEIHPPERPILTLNDFLLQLLTITVGILIALSLDGMVQWAHHRTLVREATARLTEELRENRREADDFVKIHVPKMREANSRVIRFIDDIAQKKLPAHGTVDIQSSYDMETLSSTSWNTAHVTGALGYMDYADAQKYAAAYNLQAKIEQLQDRVLDRYVTGVIRAGDPFEATPRELQEWKQQVLVISQYVDAQRQLTEALIKDYDKVLGSPH